MKGDSCSVLKGKKPHNWFATLDYNTYDTFIECIHPQRSDASKDVNLESSTCLTTKLVEFSIQRRQRPIASPTQLRSHGSRQIHPRQRTKTVKSLGQTQPLLPTPMRLEVIRRCVDTAQVSASPPHQRRRPSSSYSHTARSFPPSC